MRMTWKWLVVVFFIVNQCYVTHVLFMQSPLTIDVGLVPLIKTLFQVFFFRLREQKERRSKGVKYILLLFFGGFSHYYTHFCSFPLLFDDIMT